MKKIKIIGLLMAVALTFAGCTSGADNSATTSQTTETASVEQTEEVQQEVTENAENQVQEEFQVEEVEINNSAAENASEAALEETGSEELDGTLEVHFIDVGQGDSILLAQGEHHMLIDAGENDCGTKVQAYLQSQNISSLDYVIGTHPDSDHIGGLDVIIYKFQCENILMPTLKKDTKTYKEVISTAKERGYSITNPVAGDTFSLGEADIVVLSPSKGADYGDDANNYSIAIKVSYGDHSFVFTGDCEEEAEADIVASDMDLQADVMKAGHHGSNTSNTEELLQAVAPESVVISCGEDNEYGHPRAEVLNNLRAMGIDVYRTDEQGTIVAVSDGKEITWNTSPSQTWQAGEPKGNSEENTAKEQEIQVAAAAVNTQEAETASEQTQGTTYILNTNTMKIHYPDCSSVNQMSEKNKKETTDSIEQLTLQGYVPCNRCNP